MREIQISSNRFILHPNRVLIWPEHRLMVAADLHLGRSETYLSSAIDESPLEQWRGLLELEDLGQTFSADHILLLGDFLHSPHGLTEGIVQDFSDFLLRTDRQVTLVPSNRDKGALRLLGALFPKMEVLYQWQIDNFVFRHQPPERMLASDSEFYWCGHLNPVSSGQPCFVIDRQVGVLPAFSSVPHGNEVDPTPGREIYLCG